jgi:hypothetical protein
MNLQTVFQTDTAAEVDGRWFPIGSGARIRVARLNNPKYREVFSRLVKPHERALSLNLLEDETATALLVRAEAEAVLVGWEGLTDGPNNEPVGPYSVERAVDLLTRYPEFRAYVRALASDLANYRQQTVETAKDALGNG